ncbi:MAG TPA: hypothetical protein VEB21_04170 [Terriglobales bacterium]|nr:hypothetical protein [Terriglobales bacterium]
MVKAMISAMVMVPALLAAPAMAATDKTCLTGDDPLVASDAEQIAALEAAVELACPCAGYDGSIGKSQRDYRRCTAAQVKAALSAGNLRSKCKSRVSKRFAHSICGHAAAVEAVPCLERSTRGKLRCLIVPAAECRDRAGRYSRVACPGYESCVAAGDTNADHLINLNDSGSCIVPATATATFTPTDTSVATATPTLTPTWTSTATATATATFPVEPPLAHIVVNPGTDRVETPILPPEALTGPAPSCFPQNPSGGGCRLLAVLDGGIDLVNVFDASGSINPAAQTPDEDALTYKWDIYRPTTLQGGKYAPRGVTGYFTKQLTIAPSSFPALEDTIAGADVFWRAALTVTSIYPPFAQTTVYFRFQYQSTELTLDNSIDCYRTNFPEWCYTLAPNGIPTTEPH